MDTIDTSDSTLQRSEEGKDPVLTTESDLASDSGTRPVLSSFVEHLVENAIITEAVAFKATKLKNRLDPKDKRSVVDILVDEFGLTRDTLHYEIARFYSFRIVDPNERNPRILQPAVVSRLMNELPDSINRLAFKYKVLPFETAENQPDKLVVVTPNPSDRGAYEVARAFPYKRVEICYMSEKGWTDYWRLITLSKQQNGGDSTGEEALFTEEEADLDTVLDKEINRNELIQLVESIFMDAVRAGASDIHVVPRAPRRTEISFRIDGQLSLWRMVDDARAEAVIAVVKGKSANLDRFERMSAQDGSAQKVVDNQMVRFRMSVLPIISKSSGGKFESVVIRILKEASTAVTVESIGFDPYSLSMFKEAISKPHGMVILTGPTGSGKSTTLVAALRSIMRPSLNTITVEDPVEYIIDDARQVKLNFKLGFDDAMRAILRHDPDIVMVGEIRDRITADIAIKLANTGHLTLSTVHTNDAPSVVSRLFKIGVEPFLIAQALNIVVAQRLVRMLCPRCKKTMVSPNEQTLARLGFTPEEAVETVVFEPVGCLHCVEGYKGRTAIHESLYFTPEIREIIFDSGERIDTDRIRQAAIKHGMQTLRQSGVELIKRGITSIEEVVRTTSAE